MELVNRFSKQKKCIRVWYVIAQLVKGLSCTRMLHVQGTHSTVEAFIDLVFNSQDMDMEVSSSTQGVYSHMTLDELIELLSDRKDTLKLKLDGFEEKAKIMGLPGDPTYEDRESICQWVRELVKMHRDLKKLRKLRA